MGYQKTTLIVPSSHW